MPSFSQVNQRIDFFTQLSEAFPFELPWAIAQYWQAQQVIQSVRARLPSPSHGLTIEQAKAEVVVLVIGESSTRNAWHWFNPQAPSTTPHLEARREKGEHIYGFNRVFSQTTSTRQSVPSILTNQPLIWPNGLVNSEATKSIIWTAGQAGYSTAWFSNQAAVGEHDGIIASYAQEAQRTAFLNPSSFSDQGSFDEVLLPALSDHLAKNKKSFIVLHTMGSHFQYKHRYPKNFGPFPNPKNFGNDYFNSIAYTDMLLDKILHILQGNDRKTALIYVADHGENIPQGNCEVEGFSRSSREAYEVPALVWLSQSYAQDHPEVAKLLQRHENQIHTISSIHQTLLDLMQANTISPLPNEDSPGFLRPWKPDKNSPLAVWMQEFEKATTANPCIIIFR
ncbi:phosphoethanolamine transferase [Melaminivora sp.]